VAPPGAPRASGQGASGQGFDGGGVGGGTGRGEGDERAPALRAVDAPSPTRGPDTATSAPEDLTAEAASGPLAAQHGLALAYAVLERLVRAHGLARAAVVVDDADLGPQILLDRQRPLDDRDVALFDALSHPGGAERGLHTIPPLASLEPPPSDVELAVALVETALRVAVLDRIAADGPPDDLLELAVRRLPGVGAIVVDRGSGVVQVLAAPDGASGGDAPLDLARQIVDLATSFLDGAVAVEILRNRPAVDGEVPATATAYALGTNPTRLVAVTNAPDTQELEVHLRRGETRTIGRAPAAHGLAGGVEATLVALAELGDRVTIELDWARTIETTSQRQFLVAVALRDADDAVRYGLADEGTPIAAAARATLNALGF
jgi:hypothetical protein